MNRRNREKKRVVVAMSGGVDSSVSAALLKAEGYDVIGVSLQLYEPVPKEPGCRVKTCCALDDVMDAARVAKLLDIPFEVLDLRAEFKALVIDNFIAEYAAGRTPNPCIRCNERIKFALLLNKAYEMGADMLATGHYARITGDCKGVRRLLTGLDPAKDQSYFLFTLTSEQLQHLLFPIGFMTKPEVRRLAADFNLPIAQKHESQEICFISDNDYVTFLESHGVDQKPGKIVTIEGKVIGEHNGFHRYTVGQRKGLGIAWPKPLHVVSIDTANHLVVVAERDNLATTTLTASGATWSGAPPESGIRAACRIRYRHTPAPCQVEMLDAGRFRITFDTPQSALTPGQAAVLYDGDTVLGGGWIQ